MMVVGSVSEWGWLSCTENMTSKWRNLYRYPYSATRILTIFATLTPRPFILRQMGLCILLGVCDFPLSKDVWFGADCSFFGRGRLTRLARWKLVSLGAADWISTNFLLYVVVIIATRAPSPTVTHLVIRPTRLTLLESVADDFFVLLSHFPGLINLGSPADLLLKVVCNITSLTLVFGPDYELSVSVAYAGFFGGA